MPGEELLRGSDRVSASPLDYEPGGLIAWARAARVADVFNLQRPVGFDLHGSYRVDFHRALRFNRDSTGNTNGRGIQRRTMTNGHVAERAHHGHGQKFLGTHAHARYHDGCRFD